MPDIKELYGGAIWNSVQKSGLMGSGLIWDALYSSV